MAEYDGPERRSEENLSRRQGDVFCAEHHLRWEHHDKDATDHRNTVCGKIHSVQDGLKSKADQADVDEVKKDMKALLPKWAFLMVIPATFAFSLLLFAWTASTIKEGQTKIESSLSVIHKRITDNDKDYDQLKDGLNELKWSVNAMSGRLVEVEKKVNK